MNHTSSQMSQRCQKSKDFVSATAIFPNDSESQSPKLLVQMTVFKVLFLNDSWFRMLIRHNIKIVFPRSTFPDSDGKLACQSIHRLNHGLRRLKLQLNHRCQVCPLDFRSNQIHWILFGMWMNPGFFGMWLSLVESRLMTRWGDARKFWLWTPWELKISDST